jgi:hypothetical protein
VSRIFPNFLERNGGRFRVGAQMCQAFSRVYGILLIKTYKTGIAAMKSIPFKALKGLAESA